MKSRLPLFLASLGILLRIIPIWGMQTWYDENFTILLSRLPLDRLITATAGDVHPPLWYLICWPLAHIPWLPAWAAIRIPALLASIAAIWIWWLILQSLEISPKVRLVAFGLFCLLPQQIYYAQEGRMYALLTLLVLAAWLAILHKQWGWLFMAGALMLWLQNYGLIYAAVLWIAGLVHDRKTWKPLTLSLASAGIAFIPWLVVLFHQMGSISGAYWIPAVTFPSALGDYVHVWFGNGLLDANIFNFAVFWGVLIWVLIWSLRKKVLDVPTTILAFLPVLMVAMVSILWRPIILFRALIPSGAFLAILLAKPIGYLGRRPLMLLAIFFVPAMVVNIAGIETRSFWAGYIVDSYADSIRFIDSNWKEGDLLYFTDDATYVTGSVSWKHIDNTLRSEPCGPTTGSLSQQTEIAIGIVRGPLPAIAGRIWFVSANTPYTPTCIDDYPIREGLESGEPLMCAEDTKLVKSCLYLVKP